MDKVPGKKVRKVGKRVDLRGPSPSGGTQDGGLLAARERVPQICELEVVCPNWAPSLASQQDRYVLSKARIQPLDSLVPKAMDGDGGSGGRAGYWSMLSQPSGESIRLSISFLGAYAPHHPTVENRSIRFSPAKAIKVTTATREWRGAEDWRGDRAGGGTLLVRGRDG